MAASSLTGKLVADFSSFYEAVDKANVSLKSFDTEANKVEKSLTRMVDNFSGRRVVQDATLMTEAIERLGGATQLTAAEQDRVNTTLNAAIEKFRVLGKEAPASMLALADATKRIEPPLTLAGKATEFLSGAFGGILAGFGASAVVGRFTSEITGFFTEAIKGAGALVDMSNKTGLTIETLQRMAFVGAQTGTSLEDLTNAAFKLGVKLAGGGDSVRQAVQDLGLSYADLKAQSPDQQFEAIAAALGQMVDPQERNRIAVELFGKVAATILPAIVDHYDEIASHATTAGDAQVRAIDTATDRWDAFVKNTKAGITQHIGDLLLAKDSIGLFGVAYDVLYGKVGHLQSAIDAASASMREQADAARTAAAGLGEAATVFVPYTAQLEAARSAAADLTSEQRKEITAGVELGASYKDLSASLDVAEAAIRQFVDAKKADATSSKDAEKAARDYADALKELDINAKGWQATVNAISGSVVEAIRFYVDAGVAVKDLATAYGLSESQIRAVVRAQREEEAAAKAAAQEEAKEAAEADKAAAAADRLGQKLYFTGDALLTVSQNATTAGEMIRKLSGEMVTLEQNKFIQSQGGSFQLDQIQVTDANRAQLQRRLDELKNLFTLFPGRAPGGTGSTGLMSTDEQGYLQLLADQREYQQLMNALSGSRGGSSTKSSNSAYISPTGSPIGDLAALSPPGSIFSGGAPTANISLTINGSVLSNNADLSRAISDAVMEGMRMSGQRMPTGA
jgi:transposase-like protein